MKKKPTVIKSFDQLGEVLVPPTLGERMTKAMEDIDIAHLKLQNVVRNAPNTPETKRISLLAKQKGRY